MPKSIVSLWLRMKKKTFLEGITLVLLQSLTREIKTLSHRTAPILEFKMFVIKFILKMRKKRCKSKRNLNRSVQDKKSIKNRSEFHNASP